MKNIFLFGFLAIMAFGFAAFRPAGSSEKSGTVALPDLMIEDIIIRCASQRWLVFYVKNQGELKSIATLIRIRPIDFDDATQQCFNQAVRNVPILHPGKTFKLRVRFKPVGECDCTGPLQIEMLIDHLNYVEESDETNNEEFYTQ